MGRTARGPRRSARRWPAIGAARPRVSARPLRLRLRLLLLRRPTPPPSRPSRPTTTVAAPRRSHASLRTATPDGSNSIARALGGPPYELPRRLRPLAPRAKRALQAAGGGKKSWGRGATGNY